MRNAMAGRLFRSIRFWGLFALLISIACMERCGSKDDRSVDPTPVPRPDKIKPNRSTELVVRLREADNRRITTGVVNGDTVLLYGSVPLRQIFAGLTDVDQIDVRPSFPKYSKRWQAEREWETGRDDPAAIEVLENKLLPCLDGRDMDEDRRAIQRFVSAWRNGQVVVKEKPDGIPALVRLLTQSSSSKPGLPSAKRPAVTGGIAKATVQDSITVTEFITRLTETDNGVTGQQDDLVIPAIHRGLAACKADHADSVAVLRFTRRLARGGAVRGVSQPAMRAALDLTRGRSISLRDSLALASWIRLLSGDDSTLAVAGTSTPPPAPDLYLRIRPKSKRVKTDRLLAELRRLPEVETATRALAVSQTPPSGLDLTAVASAQAAQHIGYQQAAPIGVGDTTVWSLPGGKGENVGLIVCDGALWQQHPDLPDSLIEDESSGIDPSANERVHGTLSTGILLAKHADWGGESVNGMCPSPREARFYSYLRSTAQPANTDPLAEALDDITVLVHDSGTGGYILLLEAQLDRDPRIEADSAPEPARLPVETNPDYFNLIQRLTSLYDVIVVEPAGNGSGVLSTLKDNGTTTWDPDDPVYDSGAIMVGAGCPGEGNEEDANSRYATSNYGERVDCQGWGSSIRSTSVDFSYEPAKCMYADHMETSGASAMVAGVIGCIQSTYFQGANWYLYPSELRPILRDETLNSPQPASDERIGPLPNLDAILTSLCIDPPCMEGPFVP